MTEDPAWQGIGYFFLPPCKAALIHRSVGIRGRINYSTPGSTEVDVSTFAFEVAISIRLNFAPRHEHAVQTLGRLATELPRQPTGLRRLQLAT